MTTGKKPHKECDFFCLFFNRNKQIEIYFFFSEKHCPCTHYFWAGRKQPQSGGGCGAGLGSFPVGAGAGYIQVSLEQSFP